MPIVYVKGDATRPLGLGPRVIVHCVNDIGKWGSGFVLALDKRWPFAGARYREWSTSKRESDPPFELGAVQFVKVEPSIWIPTVWVANLVGQHRTIGDGEAIPIRYDALEKGFRTVASFCLTNEASAHMPKLGSGLARGRWPKIAALIEKEVVARGIPVTVYELAP